MRIITDAEIDSFVNEKKILPKGFQPTLRTRSMAQSYQCEIIGEKGNTYRIIIRQSKVNPQDFSVIFGVIIGKAFFRIQRYNGNSHIHYNKIESKHIRGNHIHKATQRYQEKGFAEEGFAETTPRYNDWHTALKAMLADNNFHESRSHQQTQIEEF